MRQQNISGRFKKEIKQEILQKNCTIQKATFLNLLLKLMDASLKEALIMMPKATKLLQIFTLRKMETHFLNKRIDLTLKERSLKQRNITLMEICVSKK